MYADHPLAVGSHVYLDGKEVQRCIVADEEGGYAEAYVLDHDGKTIIDPKTGNLMTAMIYGRVRILGPESPAQFLTIDPKDYELPLRFVPALRTVFDRTSARVFTFRRLAPDEERWVAYVCQRVSEGRPVERFPPVGQVKAPILDPVC